MASADNYPESEQAKASPALFPWLAGKETTIPAGGYDLITGSDAPFTVPQDGLVLPPEYSLGNDLLPGIITRGWYGVGGNKQLMVISFLYHKRDPNGQLETTERAIVWEGVGYGEHPGHAGQPPTWYLVGPQIGTYNHEAGEPLTLEQPGTVLPAKHFSVACITSGPLGEPILANPA